MFAAVTLLSLGPAGAAPAAAQNAPLRIIAFGAHPDDCELKAGGTAAKWAALGHHVKFVSVTNGDIGHWRKAGGPLAQRRTAEVQESREDPRHPRRRCSTSTTASCCRRWRTARTITRLIREWKADIVLSHRPNDYHPDHRYVGMLVQDAAYMVTVPFFCPDTPYLTKNPVFLYYEDRFKKPNPFSRRHRRGDRRRDRQEAGGGRGAGVAVLRRRRNGGPQLVPDDDAGRGQRKKEVRERFTRRFAATATRYRARLRELVRRREGEAAKYAEAFEICNTAAADRRGDQEAVSVLLTRPMTQTIYRSSGRATSLREPGPGVARAMSRRSGGEPRVLARLASSAHRAPRGLLGRGAWADRRTTPAPWAISTVWYGCIQGTASKRRWTSAHRPASRRPSTMPEFLATLACARRSRPTFAGRSRPWPHTRGRQ